MQTWESLKRQIKTAEDLFSVVKTMKTLAAVNIRQFEEAVLSLANYTRTIHLGMQIVLRNNPRAYASLQTGSKQNLGAIVFGSDQGMCGQLNDQIVNYSVTTFHTLNFPRERFRVLGVGGRVISRLEDAGLTVQTGPEVPGGLEGITQAVQELLLILDDWIGQHQVNYILLFYTRHGSATHLFPHRDRLLPLDKTWLEHLQKEPWPTKNLPTFTMDSDQLFSALVRQYLFISLFRGFAESLASENASRLRSMQAAERNIEERLGQLKTQFHQERQMAITGELLDIVSGFEALEG